MKESQIKNSTSSTSGTSVTNSTNITNTYSTSKTMNKVDKNLEYIIGIDFGHGETSVAFCPIQGDGRHQMSDIKDMNMGSTREVIPSAITIMENGDAYIGEQAFNANRLQNAAESYICFKQIPKDINGKAERIMIRFMKEVYRLIRNKQTALLDGNHIVAIATPSGWPSEAMELYKQMAEKAGMPIKFVTKESRAAFVIAQHDPEKGLAKNASKGVVVFDMGSSTLDFTFMNLSNQQTYIDNGYDCGASFVEKAMLKHLETDNPILKDFLSKYPELTATCLYEARKAKEDIYKDSEENHLFKIDFDELIEGVEDFDNKKAKQKYRPGELNELLEKEGYIAKIKDAMLHFKSEYVKDATIYAVLLTGGASRMNFIKSLVKECWHVEQIYSDDNPSVTISRGIVDVARADLLFSDDNSLDSEIQALIDSDKIYEDFVEKFGGELYHKTADAVNMALDNFANSSYDMSLNSLSLQISKEVSSAIKGASGLADKYIEDAILESSRDIRKKVEDIISHYSVGGKKFDLPVIKVKNLNINGFNMDDVLNNIASQIETESNNWGTKIAGVAMAVAMGVFGPIYLLIAGGALLLESIFGEKKTEEQKKKEAMQKKLDAGKRLEIYCSISDKLDEIHNSIYKSINSSLRGNSNIKISIKELTKEVLTEYKNKLREARAVLA